MKKTQISNKVPNPPLDFTRLDKDSFVRQLEIEQIYRVKLNENPAEFRYKMMELVSQIHLNRPDLLCKCGSADIRIMTDVEADEHTTARYVNRVREISTIAQHRARIDYSEFSPMMKAAAEHMDRVITAESIVSQRKLAKEMQTRRLLAIGREKPNRHED